MLLLLPPSEGKTAPVTGEPVDLRSISSPSLTAHRRAVLAALVRTSRAPDALDVLKVGRSLADEVHANRRLRTAPTAPAREVYSGVLYAAAGLHRLPDDDSRDRADRWVRTVSALWGLVAPGDRIPAYRLAMSTTLPRVGGLARSWRGPLSRVLDPLATDRLVVDCRSAAYAAAWPGPADGAGPGHVGVRVLRDLDGHRSIVSHSAKHTRGLITRHLITRSGPEPRTPAEVREAVGELVGTTLIDVALGEVGTGGHVLVVVVA